MGVYLEAAYGGLIGGTKHKLLLGEPGQEINGGNRTAKTHQKLKKPITLYILEIIKKICVDEFRECLKNSIFYHKPEKKGSGGGVK